MGDPGLVHGLNQQLLSRLLIRHFEDARPAEVVSYEVKLAVPKGENYTSLVYRVKINCLLTTGRKKSFSLIVKTELQSESARETLSAFPVFRTEIKMYTTILPLMEALQEEFGDRRECLWANLYGYEPYKMVAFEDLSDKGYSVANRKNSLDLKHALLVLRNLSRFHAMSKVLMSRGLISEVEDKGKYAFAMKEEVNYKWWEVMFTVLTKDMVTVWGPEWKDIADKLEKQTGLMVDRLVNSVGSDKKFEVLNHGDPWTSNIMFNYLEYEATPISSRFLDFQICHINSFIYDVEYFINTSVHYSARQNHREELLTAYQQSLEKNLTLFNYSGYIPTLDDVKAESKRIEIYQMAFLLLSSIMTADTTNAFDLEKLATHSPSEIIDACVFGSEKAKLALGEDLRRFAADGLI